MRTRESAQLKNVLELYDMEIHQKISMPNDQQLKTMVKRNTDQKLRLRNFDSRHGRIETGAVPVKRKRPAFARRPLQFPPRDPRSCAKTRTLPPHLLSQPCHEVEVC